MAQLIDSGAKQLVGVFTKWLKETSHVVDAGKLLDQGTRESNFTRCQRYPLARADFRDSSPAIFRRAAQADPSRPCPPSTSTKPSPSSPTSVPSPTHTARPPRPSSRPRTPRSAARTSKSRSARVPRTPSRTRNRNGSRRRRRVPRCHWGRVRDRIWRGRGRRKRDEAGLRLRGERERLGGSWMRSWPWSRSVLACSQICFHSADIDSILSVRTRHPHDRISDAVRERECFLILPANSKPPRHLRLLTPSRSRPPEQYGHFAQRPDQEILLLNFHHLGDDPALGRARTARVRHVPRDSGTYGGV